MRRIIEGLVAGSLLAVVIVVPVYITIGSVVADPVASVQFTDVVTERGDTLRCYVLDEKVSLFCEVLTPTN